MNLHSHTRSVADRCHDIHISPDRFTKNPDIVQTKDGRLLLVYSDNDQHWSQKTQVLTILESLDEGRTWHKLSEVDMADLEKGDERLVTPRLSALSDGRLAVLIDHDDFGHFHEAQPCGNWLYWSTDGGRTWGPHRVSGIPGFEPDRIVELPDGRLAVVSQVMREKSMEFAEVISFSYDGGATWKEEATLAHDGYHRFCEGGLIVLDGGRELAVVLRENHCGGLPGYVVFSLDGGYNWSAPQMLPFHLHRPYGKQLPDGRVLVTGRNLLGGVGTYAWCGNLRAECGQYQAGGPLANFDAGFEDGLLALRNGPGLDARYTLLPPECNRAEVRFEAELRVEGPDDTPVAFLCVSGYQLHSMATSAMVYIAPNWIMLGARGADFHKKADMRSLRRVAISHRYGLLQVSVDGQVLIQQSSFRENRAIGDWYNPKPGERTQFGGVGEQGASYWKSVDYHCVNPSQPDYRFRFNAAKGEYPDQYQRERLTLIHPNVHPSVNPWPDHGYSSHVTLPDGTIVFVDYTNLGDKPGKSHLVGGRFRANDF